MKSGVIVPLTGLILGIVTGSGVVRFPAGHPFMPGGLIVITGLILAMTLVLSMYRHSFDLKDLRIRLVVFVCSVLTGYVTVSTCRFKPPEPVDGKFRIVARIVESHRISERMEQIIACPLLTRKDSGWLQSHGKLVFLAHPDTMMIYGRGDIWEFGPVRINRVSDKLSDKGFIASRYWISRGIRHEAWLSAGQSRLIRKNTGLNILGQLDRWQSRMLGVIDDMPLSEETGGLLKAMIFGDRSGISEATRSAFTRAGIIHVISVSGLHVGIVYLLSGYLLGFISFLPRRSRSILSLIFVWIYTGITGLSPSACRAAGMVSLFGVARLTGRNGSGLDSLCAVAAIHCLVDPFTVFSAGAQLSYLAVAGIIVWMPVIKTRIKGPRIWRKVFEAAGVSLSAQSLIIPVLLFWFGWFPLYFLGGNLVLVPLLVFGFYAGLFLTGLQAAGLCPAFLCQGMDFLIAAVLRAATFMGGLPGNSFQPGEVSLADLAVYYGLMAATWSYLRNPKPAIWLKFLVSTVILALLTLVTRIME